MQVCYAYKNRRYKEARSVVPPKPCNEASPYEWTVLADETKKSTCYGCAWNHPSQKYHMDIGGCLAVKQQSQ